MKATKKHIQRLELIEGYLTRALKWLHSDDIEICRKSYPNGLSFTNKDGEALNPVFKKAGSDLQLLEHAQSRLQQTLKELNS